MRRNCGSCHHEEPARVRCALWSSDQAMGPADEEVHLRRTKRDPHHRPSEDDRVHQGCLRRGPQDGHQQQAGALRRNEEAGATGYPERGRTLRDVLREQPLARRHAHQFHDNQEVAAPSEEDRQDGDRRDLRKPHEEGSRPDQQGARAAGEEPGRHQGAQGAPRDHLHHRHAQGGDRGRRGAADGHSHRRGRRYELQPGGHRLPHPGQRRRDPRDHALHADHRERRYRGGQRDRTRNRRKPERRGRAGAGSRS